MVRELRQGALEVAIGSQTPEPFGAVCAFARDRAAIFSDETVNIRRSMLLARSKRSNKTDKIGCRILDIEPTHTVPDASFGAASTRPWSPFNS